MLHTCVGHGRGGSAGGGGNKPELAAKKKKMNTVRNHLSIKRQKCIQLIILIAFNMFMFIKSL